MAPHAHGQMVLPAVERAYRSLYQLIGAKDEDAVLFTSSGPEAVNQVIHGVYHDVSREEGKNHFVTSWADEAPAIMAVGRLEQLGASGKMAEVDAHGVVTAKAIAEALTPRTALVSLSWANGLTGVVHPVEEIAKVCRERGVLFHVDATHVLGKWEVDVHDLGADFLTFNGDHLHAPKGTGALFIRNGITLSSLIQGGMEQAGGRAGALNVAGLVALGKAAEELQENNGFIAMEGARLRDKFEHDLLQAYPEAEVLFGEGERLPTVTTVAFPGIACDALLHGLSEEGVYASFGGGNFQRLSLLLQAAKIDKTLSHTAISFSLSRETTEEEIFLAIERIAMCAKRLRKASEVLL